MKIYLDNNIFVSIEDKEIELNELKNIFGSNAKFVYSYIHVLELLEAKKDFEQLKKIRFKTINEVKIFQYFTEGVQCIPSFLNI